jgi:hypothetical protein
MHNEVQAPVYRCMIRYVSYTATLICEIWGFHSSATEDRVLWDMILMLQRIGWPSSSREDGGATVLQNVGSHRFSDSILAKVKSSFYHCKQSCIQRQNKYCILSMQQASIFSLRHFIPIVLWIMKITAHPVQRNSCLFQFKFIDIFQPDDGMLGWNMLH